MQITNVARDADEFTSNAFLVDADTLVDTGAADIVLDRLDDVVIDRVVITHSHWDHVEHLETVVDWFDPVIYAYEPANLPVEAEELADGATVALGTTDMPFLVVHTPGHRDDHVCLYSPDEQILFSGDLIFPGGSFGRTDLDQGDRDTLIGSIERIVDLDVAAMYPGHDEPVADAVNEQIRQSLTAARKHEPKYADG